MPQRKGLFIAFEGIDGVGKTTVVDAVCQYLEDLGHPVLRTKEPGGTPFAQAIRTLHLSDKGIGVNDTARALLMAASRADNAYRQILPALAEGEIVICDRWSLSSLAYQHNSNMLPEIIKAGNMGCDPDMTIILHMPVADSKARLITRAQQAGGGTLNHLDLLPDAERAAIQEVMLHWYYANPEHAVTIAACAAREVVVTRALDHVRHVLMRHYGTVTAGTTS